MLSQQIEIAGATRIFHHNLKQQISFYIKIFPQTH